MGDPLPCNRPVPPGLPSITGFLIPSYLMVSILLKGFPGSGKESTCQSRRGKRHGFHPWGGEDPVD